MLSATEGLKTALGLEGGPGEGECENGVCRWGRGG